jgi:hypothetical protein
MRIYGRSHGQRLKNLKPKAELYKVTDRDGMHRIAAAYNLNRYLAERKIMLQCWADMLDA